MLLLVVLTQMTADRFGRAERPSRRAADPHPGGAGVCVASCSKIIFGGGREAKKAVLAHTASFFGA